MSKKKQQKAANVNALWIEIHSTKEYFESLKLRDTIIGRCVLVLSVFLIALGLAEEMYLPNWLEAFFSFTFIMLLYWLAQNGYFATVAALFTVILESNFNPWSKNTETLDDKDIERIEEQRALLTNYASNCPLLPLLYFIHQNRVKKLTSPFYRKYADSPRFREKLKPNCFMYILAHFLPCEKYADQKNRVMASIDDRIYKI